MIDAYRPWGHLGALLPRIRPLRDWGILGCLGTEERSLGAWEQLVRVSHPYVRFLRINDPPSRYTQAAEERLAIRTGAFIQSGAAQDWIVDCNLFSTHNEIVSIADQFAAASPEHVVLDITSLPKRFFFPFLRRFLRHPNIQTLIVTYTLPQRYTSERLSEDPFAPDTLPTFGGAGYPPKQVRNLIVGLGFQPLGLPDMLEGSGADSIYVLFPYSDTPYIIQRVWEFARGVERDVAATLRRRVFVPPTDASEVFDYIMGMTAGGTEYSLLAPYGPKPMSLGMALAAHAADWPVQYTQPSVYHPDYSLGIRRGSDGMPLTYAYMIRTQGRNLYGLP